MRHCSKVQKNQTSQRQGKCNTNVFFRTMQVKFSLVWFSLVRFNGIPTFVSYLMPNITVYTHMLYIQGGTIKLSPKKRHDSISV